MDNDITYPMAKLIDMDKEIARETHINKLREYALNTITYTDIKGKPYAEVKDRIAAFRLIYPEGTITTKIIELDDNHAVVRAEVLNERGELLASAYAAETFGSSNFTRTNMLEVCDTSAVGRALGFLGIGVKGAVASVQEVERANRINEETNALHVCRRCGRPIIDTQDTAGKIWKADEIAKYTLSQAGDCYCLFCLAEIAKAGDKFNKGATT